MYNQNIHIYRRQNLCIMILDMEDIVVAIVQDGYLYLEADRILGHFVQFHM